MIGASLKSLRAQAKPGITGNEETPSAGEMGVTGAVAVCPKRAGNEETPSAGEMGSRLRQHRGLVIQSSVWRVPQVQRIGRSPRISLCGTPVDDML
jgi:hypothetical protein